eukprot:scaffold1374_cov175-Amphora_coffeaeformis.AAC.3
MVELCESTDRTDSSMEASACSRCAMVLCWYGTIQYHTKNRKTIPSGERKAKFIWDPVSAIHYWRTCYTVSSAV